MKKNILYLLISIITLICFFGTAAICNQCAADTVEDVGSTEGENGVIAEEEADENGDTTSEIEEEESEEEESSEEEDTEEEESPEEEEEIEEETPEQEEQEEAPTITLEIYEGPVYSQADDVCYWRVKAVVTGVPAPQVQFNRDDSNGAWGSKKAQVNLVNPTDSYSLSATATNSAGVTTDSISLSWECNRPPEISDITMMGDHFTGVEYTISAAASDPDGDTLTYSWSVSGGTLNSSSGNPVKWTMPGTAGNYQITIEADDGNGGSDSRTESVDVMDALGPPIAGMELPIISGEGGYISKNGTLFYTGEHHLVGDSTNNEPVKSFISFDITGLSGATIESAELQVTPVEELGDASGFVPLLIAWISWEPGIINTNDFNLGSNAITNVSSQNFTIGLSSAPKLRQYIQEAINGGKDRFQLVFYFTGMASDNDNANDYWLYTDSYINLTISYTH